MDTKRKLATGILGTAMAVALMAGPASADSSRTVIAPAARATVNFSPGSWGDINGGWLYDTNRYDGRCARLYERGYNYALQYTSWHKIAEVCAGGSVRIPAVHYSGYSDHVDVKVCAGTVTSGTACAVTRLW